MIPTTSSRGTRVFKAVRCEGLGDGELAGIFALEVTDGHLTIGDDRLEISADMVTMVCKGRHSDRRVRLTYQEDGHECTLYLRDRGLRGRVQGNQPLYSAVHDALIPHVDSAYDRV